MTQRLLTDYTPLFFDREMISEAISDTGPLVLKHVVLQRANQPNQNKRIYPRPLLEREVDKYNKEFVMQKRATGELDHTDESVVNLKNVALIVRQIGWSGDDVIGNIEILPTPSGNIAKSLIKADVKLGISSRGLGEVKSLQNDIVEVSDYNLISFDLVSNPSTVGAIINESVNSKIQVQSRFDRLIYDFLNEIR